MSKRLIISGRLAALILATPIVAQPDPLSEVDLGRMLFMDPSLSMNHTQSCASCHDPAQGFTDHRETPALGIASLGDDGHSFGSRNASTASYAQTSPAFHYDDELGEYVGGQFLDGRAATLADQAGGPPLNPLEMGMHNSAAVVERLRANPLYRESFITHYGDDVWADSESAYKAMTTAIAAFEQTDFFAPYDSKYDRFLRGEYELTVLEDLGRTLFFSETNVNCSTCHKLRREDAEREPFTNHQYRNIGVPSNPNVIRYAGLPKDFVDHGLLENPAVTDPQHDGKFKTPTLRNVAVTAPYMHNGVFADLRTVVEFYDQYNNPERTRNPETGKPWRDPEVPETIAREELKAKVLTDRKIDALIAFMKTLTDARYEHLLE